MNAVILDGRMVASEVKAEVAERVAALRRPPGLATVLVGDDQASHTYVRGKRRDAAEVGMESFHYELDASTSQTELEDLIDELNRDDRIDGILVQLPLPEGLDSEAITARIDPSKDVDGLHPYNLGLLVLNRPGLRPCTPGGVMRILDHYEIGTSGKTVAIVGRSFLVGRPLALMLSAKGADATVTIAHSRTTDLEAVTRQADVVVSAVGHIGLIGPRHVRRGAVVVDVGINRDADSLVGDVQFDEVSEVAAAITPVPGGVGPMTRAMLMVNTVTAAESRSS